METLELVILKEPCPQPTGLKVKGMLKSYEKMESPGDSLMGSWLKDDGQGEKQRKARPPPTSRPAVCNQGPGHTLAEPELHPAARRTAAVLGEHKAHSRLSHPRPEVVGRAQEGDGMGAAHNDHQALMAPPPAFCLLAPDQILAPTTRSKPPH